MVRRVRFVAFTVLAISAVALPSASAAPPRRAAGLESARSVLIISLPATEWIDLRDAWPPALTRLLRHSALADLATRTVRNRTEPGGGYTALGAGGRAVAPTSDAATNMQESERFAGQRAASAFRTRTGLRLVRGVGALGWPQIVVQNDATSYDTEVGALGTALTAAGIDRFVIANADQPSTAGPVYHREAALGTVDSTGRTPGLVTGITRPAPDAPYGRALDIDAVDAAFPADFRTRRQVVLVEASDLARADEYRPLATPEQRAVLHSEALARSDELVARLLTHVDLRRDAVVVVSPYHTGRTRTLTTLGIHTPGGATGMLESATTRRSGFVQIVDIAPTVLELLDIEPPDSMEGRAARLHPESGPYRERVDRLVRADRAAQFRDATIGQATAILVVATIVLAVGAGIWYRFGRRTGATTALSWASLTLISYVVATYLAGVFPFFRWGTAAYFGFVVATAVAITAAAVLIGRGPADPVLIVLGIVVLLHVGDVITGTRLQFNTVFGYSPTVGIRLAGIGNPGSAQVSMAALLFAVLITWRLPGRGTIIGYGVLIATLIAVGAPTWGQDYGGALALAPTIVVWWLLRSERRFRVRTVLAILGVLVITGLVAGFVDLSRPENERTHVGRFFEKVGDDGIGGFVAVVGRKLSLMISTFSNTAWVLLGLSVVVLAILAVRRTDVPSRLAARIPTLRPGMVCAGVLVVLATALNDSGVQVTGMMLATLLPVLVSLATRTLDDDEGAAIGRTPDQGRREESPLDSKATTEP